MAEVRYIKQNKKWAILTGLGGGPRLLTLCPSEQAHQANSLRPLLTVQNRGKTNPKRYLLSGDLSAREWSWIAPSLRSVLGPLSPKEAADHCVDSHFLEGVIAGRGWSVGTLPITLSWIVWKRTAIGPVLSVPSDHGPWILKSRTVMPNNVLLDNWNQI